MRIAVVLCMCVILQPPPQCFKRWLLHCVLLPDRNNQCEIEFAFAFCCDYFRGLKMFGKATFYYNRYGIVRERLLNW